MLFRSYPAFKIVDSGGNTVTSATNTVTMALTVNGGTASFGGTLTQAAALGVGTFSAAITYTSSDTTTINLVTYSAPGLTSATHNILRATGTAPARPATFSVTGTATVGSMLSAPAIADSGIPVGRESRLDQTPAPLIPAADILPQAQAALRVKEQQS